MKKYTLYFFGLLTFILSLILVSSIISNNIQEEIGDLLFTLHCYANINKFNFEKILNNANTKFEKRFNKLLEIAKSKNIDFLKSSSEIKEKLMPIVDEGISWLDNNNEATTERYEELINEFSQKLGLSE